MRNVLAIFLVFLISNPFAFAGAVSDSDEAIYQKVKATLKDSGDRIQRTIHRIGNQTIEMEAFIGTDGDITLAPIIFADYPNYRKWALEKINIKPSGNSFLLKILDLAQVAEDKEKLKATFRFDLPLMPMNLSRNFKVTTESQGKVFTARIESDQDPASPVGKVEGFLRIYAAENSPGRLWLYVRATARLTSWLLYEALPERLLNHESADRLQIIVDNYSREEERLHVLRTKASEGNAVVERNETSAKSSQTPKGKMAEKEEIPQSKVPHRQKSNLDSPSRR